MKISDMHKHGWIQIDPEKPINEQVSVGDYVVHTGLGVFRGEGRFIEFNQEHFESWKNDFRAVEVGEEDLSISLDVDDEYVLWDYPETFFVLKSKVNYITVKVPDFMLDKVKQLGGVEVC